VVTELSTNKQTLTETLCSHWQQAGTDSQFAHAGLLATAIRVSFLRASVPLSMATHVHKHPEDLPVTVIAVVACAAHEASKLRLPVDGTKVVVYYYGIYYKAVRVGGGASALLELVRWLESVGPDFVHEL
jgi:hypothetical protein